MDAIEKERGIRVKHSPDDAFRISVALQALATALVHVQPLLSAPRLEPEPLEEEEEEQEEQEEEEEYEEEKDDKEEEVKEDQFHVSAQWLMDILSTVPSELGTRYLAEQVWEAAIESDTAQQQDTLFSILGYSEQAMTALEQLIPHMSEIAIRIEPSQLRNMELETGTTTTTTPVTVELEAEKRRRLLLQEAKEAAEIAAMTNAELVALEGGGSAYPGATHQANFASVKEARKQAERAQKRADQAMQRAKDAGALVEGNDAFFAALDTETMGQGGLVGRSSEELTTLQQSLLPEGAREYYDQRGLPKGTIHESFPDYEKVIIPPAERDETKLHPRLLIAEIMNPQEQLAFDGTMSLNPMQSTVFDIAFHHRDNMLICAPTGAGKTNVAMLAVVAHFRDVGLIQYTNDASVRNLETGDKVVYIAPMKALAQEVVEKFSSKLSALGLIVRELTGDMQLTRAEAESANVIVTTPEKWDVVTRKSGSDDNSIGNKCGLLIIDEVHLLADDRGAVIESVVARLHRLVESRQRQTRIVGLSATLPNYQDVAEFLQVPSRATFFFGPEHRPVPLEQTFIGVRTPNRDRVAKENRMNELCFDVVLDSLRRGYQVMVFVHSRKGTGDTAKALADIAQQENVLETFFLTQGKERGGEAYNRYVDRVKKSRNREVGIHFDYGMGIHHAGMLRGDRKLTEQMFSDGAIKVLCCTATLAWGINLPAHTVVIKGTDVYNPEKGGVVDLSILDVQQIFGRAGRPQFDKSGEATMITSAEVFPKYMDKLVRAVAIESNFIKQLADHLNAEVVGGTVTSIKEGAMWLKYSYLYIRMLRNPLAYGISADEKADDPTLTRRCTRLIMDAARLLNQNKMIRYSEESGNLSVARSGKVAAHFYVQAESIATFNEMLERGLEVTDGFLIKMVCAATEFHNMKVRQEEFSELSSLHARHCPIRLTGAGLEDSGFYGNSLVTSPEDKAFILIQCFISRSKINSFTLISDMNYVASNAGRIARSLLELCIGDANAVAALKLLRLAKAVDTQIWWFQTPVRHFEKELGEQQFSAIELYGNSKRYDGLAAALDLLELQPSEVGQIVKSSKAVGEKVQRLIRLIPNIELGCSVQPITSEVFNFHITIVPSFEWVRRWHGGAQAFWMWVEDGGNNRLYHHEFIIFAQRNFPEPLVLDLAIPVFGRTTSQYLIRAASDSWVGAEYLLPVSLDNVVVPGGKRPETDLQDLTPLPISALRDSRYESLYSNKFATFNPIQTQLFHVLYYTETPVFLGAPTGSGKTIVSELAVLRMKKLHPKGICVYIAPLKSLARERLKEWQLKFGGEPLRWSVLELSGDTHHDRSALEKADILVCTPEKWDLITRGWKGEADVNSNSSNGKAFVKRVRLLVMDEVHLVGEERGAVLEAIVSRTRYISRLLQDESPNRTRSAEAPETTRIIGLSTPLENPLDLGDWIGIDAKSHSMTSGRGVYNFRNSVRPVPLRVHVQGFTGRHYCPRMATMNKPCFAAIKDYSPEKPALIFVASRRQTRLTAFDIISNAAADETPKRFLRCPEHYIESIAAQIQDEALRHVITFGVGLHHAGLSSNDREIVENLYSKGDIQVLVATATLAWGVNLPARLVIVKGTEYFDGKVSRYVDYPLTDVLQMIGRAGRPGFDNQGEAVVMCVEDKKVFFKNFLFKPFPLESCLAGRICEIMNAEIAGGTISSREEAIGYLSWTFYARRVKRNPSYYGVKSANEEDIQAHFVTIVERTLENLLTHGCLNNQEGKLSATTLGAACCYFYLDHRTPKQMELGIREARKIITNLLQNEVPADSSSQGMVPFVQRKQIEEVLCAWLLYTLCSTHEFDEIPVRHNEEFLNKELSDKLKWGPDAQSILGKREVYRVSELFAQPHTKAYLLVQAHLEHAKLPISDFVNDSRAIVENVPRLLSAMEFIAVGDAASDSFELMTELVRLRQIWKSRTHPSVDPLVQLSISENSVHRNQTGVIAEKDLIPTLLDLRTRPQEEVLSLLQKLFRNQQRSDHNLKDLIDSLFDMPLISLRSTKTSTRKETSGKLIGELILDLEIQRAPRSRRALDEEYSLSILVGTTKQKILLSRSSVRLAQKGSWSVSKTMLFDYAVAAAEGNKVSVRLLLNEVRGLDFEISVSLV